MNLEEKLQTVVSQTEKDSGLWHTIVHGNEMTTVPTENGFVPTVSKQLKDIRDAITGGVNDVVSQTENAKNVTLQLRNETQILRNESENFKNLAQNSFNSQIDNIRNEGQNQVNQAKSHVAQALYYAQSAAPTPLGSKLTIPASAKIPDGYEPVWYKNTITRGRYPDFFAQLVDTNSLILVDEATYNNQVALTGMCASYVLIDSNTLILPLLVNFGRGGIPSQLGGVELDQFQGHFHQSAIYTQDYGTGEGKGLNHTNGSLQLTSPYMNVGYPTSSLDCGEVRWGDETRPKGYYELTYIKCADVSRQLTEENTSQIRTELTQRLTTYGSNINLPVFLSNLGLIGNEQCNVIKFTVGLPSGNVRTLIFQYGALEVPPDSDLAFNFHEPFPNAFLTGQASFCAGFNTSSDAGCGLHTHTQSGAVARNGSIWTGYISWWVLGY